MKINKLDQLFRNVLSTHKVEPSPAAWQKLESQLHERKRSASWRWVAAAAVLILFFWVGWSRWEPGSPSHTISDRSVESVNPTIEKDPGVAELKQKSDLQLESAKEVAPAPEMEKARVLANKGSKRIEDTPSKDEPKDLQEIETPPQPLAIIASAPLQEEAPLRNQQTVEKDHEFTETVRQREELPTNEVAMTSVSGKAVEKVPIRIVYKRGNRADLLAVNNQNFVKKGFKKLGDFTEDLRMSEEKKAKLRSTKDDFLAFNIEKLFKRNENEIE